ncbi:hypothetical protein HDU84_005414 [Entophlyctis sp. JEL0112]|nr:hypothetical protein HDU84_005414 [Entophlyctis sp. JEL0112]
MRPSLVTGLAYASAVRAASGISADTELSGCYVSSADGTAVDHPALCGPSCSVFAAINYEFTCVCSLDLSEFVLGDSGCTFNCSGDSSMTCGTKGNSTLFSVFLVESATTPITSPPPDIVIPILLLSSASATNLEEAASTAMMSLISNSSTTSTTASNAATASAIIVVLAILAVLAALLMCGWDTLKARLSCVGARKSKRQRQIHAVEEEASADDYFSTLQRPSKVERFLDSLSRGGRNCTPTKSVVFDFVDLEGKFEDADHFQGTVVTMGPTVAELYEAVME